MYKIIINTEKWIAFAEAVFGEDRNKWVFVCPKCGREQSVHMCEITNMDLKDTAKEFIGQTCIFRNCDHSHFRHENPIRLLINDPVYNSSLNMMDFSVSLVMSFNRIFGSSEETIVFYN